MKTTRRGFTLAEVIVMSLIFSIFSMTAVAGLTLALRYWNQANQRMLAEQNVRVAMQTMTAELRQAIVDPDPGASHAATGYLSITPTVPATGIMTPNTNARSATSLVFTEPSASYDVNSSTFSDTNPQYYQKVSYFIQNNSLKRQIFTFDSTGTVTTGTPATIVSASSSGTLLLTVTWLSATTVHLQVVAQESVYSFSLATDVTTVTQ